jgi:hypothetical protein
VAAGIECHAAVAREHVDDAIPAAAMKAGGMREEKGRIFARPVPDGEPLMVGGDEVEVGRFQTGIVDLLLNRLIRCFGVLTSDFLDFLDF